MENLAVVLDCDPKFTATQEAKVMLKGTWYLYIRYEDPDQVGSVDFVLPDP